MECSQWFCGRCRLRIGEISRRSGLPRDTIRYYEREGLISSEPSTEPSNSYRSYTEDAV